MRGSFFGPDGRYYKAGEMLDYFRSIHSREEFEQKVEGINGYFSVVVEMQGDWLLATDIIRSLPLFYRKTEKGWIITDEARMASIPADDAMNEEAVLEFSGTGYVTGAETLIKGLWQVQAGEIVSLGEEAKRHFYFSYRANSLLNLEEHLLIEKGLHVLEKTFKRLLESLEGRMVAVPLSGGFDSRLIAVMLKRAGYDKVICFSYGRKGNPEARISEKVAEQLAFPWYFVEYNPKLIDAYVSSESFKEYYSWAANYTSMFFMQEYFAVKYLKENSLVEKNTLFIPGHSGDFIGGSQFAKHGFSALEESVSNLVDRILSVKYHYHRYTGEDKNKMKKRIAQRLADKGELNTYFAYSVHEDWDFKEKFAKFNVNSNAIYTFFGFEFRMPFWDREIVDFFRQLPVSWKVNKRLYDALLEEYYFKPNEVLFKKELQSSPIKYAWGRFKKRVKRFLPPSFINLFTRKEDLLCYREITAMLQDDLRSKSKKGINAGNRYNRVIIHWYLQNLENLK